MLALRDVRVLGDDEDAQPVRDVFFRDALVVDGPPLNTEPLQEVDASGLLLVPGLIDIHTHVFPGYPISLSPAKLVAERAAPVLVDAGTAGCVTFEARSEELREGDELVLAFLNLSSYGLLTNLAGIGELSRPEFIDEERTLNCLRSNRDVCVGLKIRLGEDATGPRDPLAILDQATAVAERAGCALMVHIADLRGSLPAVLDRLRPGDIVTHVFHGGPSGLRAGGEPLLRHLREAQAGGVVFDVGYGVRHLDLEVLAVALREGFYPDTISSDAHLSLRGLRVPSLITMLSKIISLGMPLHRVILAVTERPRQVIQAIATPDVRERLRPMGSLEPGSVGNALLLAESADGELAVTAAVLQGRIHPRSTGVDAGSD